MTLFRQVTTRWVDGEGKRVPKSTEGAKKVRSRSRKWYGRVGGKKVPLSAFEAEALHRLYLPASASKNGRGVEQPIPPDVADLLRGHLQDRPAALPLWPGTWAADPVEILCRDLDTAGIPYRTEGPDGPLFADFHALRHTYIRSLDRAGVSLKQAMQLARHSDPRLTARVYGRSDLNELGEAVGRLKMVTQRLPAQPTTGQDDPLDSCTLVH